MAETATFQATHLHHHHSQTTTDRDTHQDNTRRGSDTSSVLSLQILRERLQNTSSFQPKKSKNETWYRIENLSSRPTTRPISFSANAQSRERRSHSITQPSSAGIHRPLTRKTMSSGHLLRNSSMISANQSASARNQKRNSEMMSTNSQGVTLYERRKSAVPKRDKSGNISYSERKNMRRGSLFVAQHIPRNVRTIHDDSGDNDSISVAEDDDEFIKPPAAYNFRRQSLQLPPNLIGRSRRGSGDSIHSAGSSADSETILRSQMAASLNRRRRSRAPAALAEDIALLVPRKPNPVSINN